MIQDPQSLVLALFLAFCRVAGCLMVLPGFSTARVPMMFRLLIAVTVSLAMLPLMWDAIYPKVHGDSPTYVLTIFHETFIGTVLGMITRFYTLGLQFLGTVVTQMIGLNTPPAGDILEDASEGQLTNLLTFAGLMVLFMMDFHHQLFLALAQSYKTWPVNASFDTQKALVSLVDTLSSTFAVMLRLASPFILFNVLFNVAIGFINKLAPVVPVYFISTPYQVLGGMLLFYFGIVSLLTLFGQAFGQIFN
jgi:flagellar biosynthetic protein FliR